MTETQISLSDVLAELAKNCLQIKLAVGYQDSINNYGWHVVYYVEVFKTVEFCSKCRAKFNVDYKDDYYPAHHQHSHSSELKLVFADKFRSEAHLINALKNINVK